MHDDAAAARVRNPNVLSLREAAKLQRARAKERAAEAVLCRCCKKPVPKARVVRRKTDARVLGYRCGRCGWAEGLGVRRRG